MILFASCIAGTVLSYIMGLRTPGKGYGTVAGWAVSLALGAGLALLYYAYSAYGIIFSLDSLAVRAIPQLSGRRRGGVGRHATRQVIS